jgi:hypothetical protein
MENSLKKHLGELAGIVPQGFALLIGLTYASGFLCVFTFLDRFGIHESGEDFFRAKYVHVGILFLLFPVSILLPFLLSLSVRKVVLNLADNKGADESSQKTQSMGGQEKQEKFHVPVSSILIFMNMCAVFYIFFFTPRDFALKRIYIFPLIFLVSFLGPLLTDNFVKKNIVPHKSDDFAKYLRWFFVLVLIGALDYFAFKGYLLQLWKIFWGDRWIPDGAIYYFILIILIPFTLWRTNDRCKQINHLRAKTEMRLSAICLIGMFYFLSIIAFALTVYPAIPVSKGGGNYAESPCVKLNFHPVPGLLPVVNAVNPLEQELSTSNNFVIVEITPSSLFLARTNDNGGPMKWQKMRDLPNIIELRRDSIDEIVYTQTANTNAGE